MDEATLLLLAKGAVELTDYLTGLAQKLQRDRREATPEEVAIPSEVPAHVTAPVADAGARIEDCAFDGADTARV